MNKLFLGFASLLLAFSNTQAQVIDYSITHRLQWGLSVGSDASYFRFKNAIVIPPDIKQLPFGGYTVGFAGTNTHSTIRANFNASLGTTYAIVPHWLLSFRAGYRQKHLEMASTPQATLQYVSVEGGILYQTHSALYWRLALRTDYQINRKADKDLDYFFSKYSVYEIFPVAGLGLNFPLGFNKHLFAEIEFTQGVNKSLSYPDLTKYLGGAFSQDGRNAYFASVGVNVGVRF